MKVRAVIVPLYPKISKVDQNPSVHSSSYSYIPDVQLSCPSPALLCATLRTEKTHFQAIFRSVKCSCSESTAIWLVRLYKPPVRAAPFRSLGTVFPQLPAAQRTKGKLSYSYCFAVFTSCCLTTCLQPQK